MEDKETYSKPEVLEVFDLPKGICVLAQISGEFDMFGFEEGGEMAGE